MNKTVLLFSTLFLSTELFYAQAPKLYFNLVSHNEPNDNLDDFFPFQKSRGLVLQFADLVKSKNARWNLQTCDGFVEGALAHETANANVLRTLASATYNSHVQIDPRNKNNAGRNIADLVYLLDSCGADPSNTLGGFVWFSNNSSQIDWFQYQDTIYGNVHPARWKADLMWGAGSLPPHTNDINDYGIWKPDTTNTFHTHNSDRTVWYIGNGCAPVLDSLDDETQIIADLQARVDSLQQGYFDASGFYSYSITINQNQFGPMLFQKLATIMDSVNVLVTENKVVWALLEEKFTAFQNDWQATPDDAWLWLCGQSQTPTGTALLPDASGLRYYPNPATQFLQLEHNKYILEYLRLYDFSGRLVQQLQPQSYQTQLDLSGIASGIYTLEVRSNGSLEHFQIVKK